MIAGALEIQMSAGIARIADDMKKVQSTIGSAMANVERAVASAEAALGALGVGLGAGYFISLIKGSIDAADKLNDLNKATRIGVETLAGIRLAAKQSGSDLESIAQSISKLGQNIGKEPDRFKRLGITAKEPLEAFKQLADITNRLSDTNQRNAVLAAALGKSWQGAASLLSEGGAKIGEMIDKGIRLSGMTKAFAEDADRLKDQLEELNTSFDRSKTQLAVKLMPALADIVKAMAAAAEESNGLKVAWVGLGGTLAWLLGLTEPQKLAARIKEINESLLTAKKQLETGTMNPPGTGSSFFNFLIPDVRLTDAAKERLRQVIAELEAEKRRLLPPEPPRVAGATGPTAEEVAKAAAAARAFLETTKARDEAYATLIRRIAELHAEEQQELMGQEKLTEGQKLALKTVIELATGKHDFTLAQKREAAARLEEMLGIDTELKRRRELLEIQKIQLGQITSEIAERERLDEVVTGFRKSQIEVIRDIEFETKLISAEAQANGAGLLQRKDEIELVSRLSKAREIAIGLRRIDLDLEREILKLGPEITTESEKRRKELEATAEATRKALPDAIAAREAAKLANDLARESISEFNSLWSTVERTGHDVFVNVFSDGKKAFEGIGRAIKASVIDLLYQITAKRWIIQIGASIAGSLGISTAGTALAGANAASSGFNLFSGASNLFSSSGGSFLGGLVSGIGSSTAELAALIESGTAGLAGAGLEAAAGIGTLSGSLIGLLGPIGLAAAGITLLSGLFKGSGDAMRTSNYAGAFGQSTTRSLAGLSVGGYPYNYPNNQWFSADMWQAQQAFDKQLQDFEQGLISSLHLTATQIDDINKQIQANIGKQYAFGMEHTGVAVDPKLMFDRLMYVLNVVDPKLKAIADSFGLTGEEALKAVSALLQVRQELQTLNLPADALTTTLIKASGGILGLQSALEAYYKLFYTDAERSAAAAKTLQAQFAALNIVMPSTRSGFRALVESLDVTTASGQEAFAALLNLAPAFDEMVKSIEAGTVAANDTTDAYKQLVETMNQLSLGDLSPLSTSQKFAEASGNLQMTFDKALKGDAESVTALSQAATDFLEASRAMFSSSSTYTANFNLVMSMLSQVAALVQPHATGGMASGWSLLGERGPEIVNFRTPAQVYTADQTRGMFAANDDLLDEVKGLKDELQRVTSRLDHLAAIVRAGDIGNMQATDRIVDATLRVADRQEAQRRAVLR